MRFALCLLACFALGAAIGAVPLMICMDGCGLPPVRVRWIPCDHASHPSMYNVSAYAIDVRCCGKADGITTSGVKVTGSTWRGMRVVAAPRSIPFYTVLTVESVGECVVLDRGSRITEGHLDVLCASYGEAIRFGRRFLEIRHGRR